MGDRLKLDNPPALVLAIAATGLAVARILNRYGVEVYGAGIAGRDIGRFSKYIRKPAFGYRADFTKEFLCKLIAFARKFPNRPVLIPASDQFIEFVSEHYSSLKSYYRLQESLSPKVSTRFLDKKRFYNLCDRLKVSYPRTLFPIGDETVDDILDQLSLPIIVKPELIHKWKKYLRGHKVIQIRTKAELKSILMDEKKLLKNSIIQEVIPGPEDNNSLHNQLDHRYANPTNRYFSRKGELLCSFTGKKIRQYPTNFGTGSYVVSCRADDVESISVDFLKRAKFKGVCGTELKYDPRDHDYKMIEVNIRPQTWEDATRAADRNVVWYAYCDLAGLDVEPPAPQKNGAIWTYLIRDVLSGFWHVKNKNTGLATWLNSYCKRIDTDALIDWKDINLLCALPGYFLKEAIRHK